MVVVHRDNNDLVCMRVEAIILVHQMSMGFPLPVFLMILGTK